MKVDWSNLSVLGSNFGTIDAVAFSATAALALTVAIAIVIATIVAPSGKLSDDAAISVAATSAVLDVDASIVALLAVDASAEGATAFGCAAASAAVVVDLHRKRSDLMDPSRALVVIRRMEETYLEEVLAARRTLMVDKGSCCVRKL